MWTKKDSQKVWTHPKTVDALTVAGNVPADEGPVGDVPDSQLPEKGWMRGESWFPKQQYRPTGPHVPYFYLLDQAERHAAQFLHALTHREASQVGQQLLPVPCEEKMGQNAPQMDLPRGFCKCIKKIFQPTFSSVFAQISNFWRSTVILV